ncbi:MAG TPA: YggT family protein [Streptosporangiaceae bacterium]|nr:YggT family protein [Streptosporangiaceae bacterium]
MGILKIVLTYVFWVYLLILIGRMILGWVQAFSRSWTPHGVLLVVAEGIFTLTDPPLRFLRRYIPPLRLGSVALDLSFMVLFFVILIMVNVVVPRI